MIQMMTFTLFESHFSIKDHLDANEKYKAEACPNTTATGLMGAFSVYLWALRNLQPLQF